MKTRKTRTSEGRIGKRLGALSLAIVLAAGLEGCAHRQPDLRLIYQDLASRKEGRPPLIGIPGLMGSFIQNPTTGEVLWGRVSSFLSTDKDMRLALPLDPDQPASFIPAGAIPQVGAIRVYEEIAETLIQDGGYTDASVPDHLPPAPLLPFSYDWRLSCAENAGRLGDLIASVQRSTGRPDLQVDIVAHSMGGLITRYYLLYGGRNVLGEPSPKPTHAGAVNVRKVVMFGTPNRGSVGALLALARGARVGLAYIPPDLVATMPSMVELMPSPSDSVVINTAGEIVPLNLYDVETWRREGWGVFDPAMRPGMINRYLKLHPQASKSQSEEYLKALQARFGVLLKQAEAFHHAVEAEPPAKSVQTLLMGGDCTPTLKAVVVEREDGRWVIRRGPSEVRHPVPGVDLERLCYGPGDGSVTKASLLGQIWPGDKTSIRTDLPGAHAGFICEAHRSLVSNATFRDNLLNFLLYEPYAVSPPNGNAPEEMEGPSLPRGP